MSKDNNPSAFHLSKNFFFFGFQSLLSFILHNLNNFIQVCWRSDFRDSKIKAILEVELPPGFKHVGKARRMKHDRTVSSKIRLCTDPLPFTIICLPVLDVNVFGFCAPPGGNGGWVSSKICINV